MGQVWEESTVVVLSTHSLCQCQFLSASSDHFFSSTEAPLLMRLCQDVWLKATCSQEVWLISSVLRELFRASLNDLHWPPCKHFPVDCLLKKSCLGMPSSDILATWPALLTWCFINMVWMVGTFAAVWTSLSGTLSCHLTFRILHRHVRWKWLNLHACPLYTVHVSYIYRRVGRITA